MALDPDYGDVPHNDEGNPVFLILPNVMRKQYQDRMKACEEGWAATGDPLFVTEAITWVRIYRQTIPVWVDGAVLTLAENRRTLIHEKRAKESFVRAMRFRAVEDLVFEVRGTSVQRTGLTWDKAYLKAATHLEGTELAAAPETMAEAYKAVHKDLKEGRGGRYHFPQKRRD